MRNEILISQATLKNWERLNVDYNNLQEKLTKRANKRYSQKTIIPVEYFTNNENFIILDKILTTIPTDIKACIYSLALNILNKNRLIKLNGIHYTTTNEFIREILDNFGSINVDTELLTIDLPSDEKDFLGIVYQSLLKEGNKNEKGSYYTPQNIINNLISVISENSKFLDPCCGTGSFLISAAGKIKNPENIFGFDIDETACFIAKINLIIKYKHIKFRPNIFNMDFLLANNTLPEFDVIATNPPWGAVTSERYKKEYPQISSDETFSYFIVKAERKLSPKGIMIFVLPESILNVKTHKDIRKFILKNFHISKIDLLGRAFSSVLTKVVVLNLDKNFSSDDILINEKNKQLHLCQNFYDINFNNNFSILDNKDIKILEKIYGHKHQRLDSRSIWALGIVTGANGKHITDDPSDGEKIYSGKNILKYKITDSNKYIKYNRKNFQQIAPEGIYRAKEKLVYKFISKNLIFAYDNKQRLFLNSANILIPKLNNYSIKTVMTLLNSTVFQYIYMKRFNELKILKGNLMKLPFPDLTESEKKKLENLSQNPEKNIEKTNKLIFEIFNLTQSEQDYINKELSG